MSSSSQAQGGGVGCLTVLGIVFVVLKLVGTIDWSWWWVLAPFWVPAVLLLAILGVAAGISAISRR
jgi:hypothetical protein